MKSPAFVFRRWFLLAFAIIATRILTADEVPFLVIGDWGKDGTPGQLKTARQMAVTAADIHSRFVLSTGDNFYDSGVKSVNDPQWKTSFENVYTGESLQTPWYVSLGNHDYGRHPQAEVDYTRTSKRWRMPARYFTWTEQIDARTTVQFFAIDTNPFITAYRALSFFNSDIAAPEQDPRKQLAWLDRELAASKAQWKIVFGHHPIYSGGVHGDTPEIITNVLPLLERYGVQIYLNGHDHNLEHLRSPTIDCFCSGGGSEARTVRPNRYSLFSYDNGPGFLAVRLTASKMQAEFINCDGKLLYTTEVPVKH